MTWLERLRRETWCRCGEVKNQLFSHIDSQERTIADLKAENARLVQRTANFERMKETIQRMRSETTRMAYQEGDKD